MTGVCDTDNCYGKTQCFVSYEQTNKARASLTVDDITRGHTVPNYFDVHTLQNVAHIIIIIRHPTTCTNKTY